MAGAGSNRGNKTERRGNKEIQGGKVSGEELEERSEKRKNEGRMSDMVNL